MIGDNVRLRLDFFPLEDGRVRAEITDEMHPDWGVLGSEAFKKPVDMRHLRPLITVVKDLVEERLRDGSV